MADMLSIPDLAKRAASEGLPVSPYAIRLWIKNGKLPHVSAGRKILVYFPNLVKLLQEGEA